MLVLDKIGRVFLRSMDLTSVTRLRLEVLLEDRLERSLGSVDRAGGGGE